MQIKIRVIAGARKNAIQERDGILRIYTTIIPENGRANEAVIKSLSGHFNVPKSNIKIIRGGTNRDKVIEILN